MVVEPDSAMHLFLLVWFVGSRLGAADSDICLVASAAAGNPWCVHDYESHIESHPLVHVTVANSRDSRKAGDVHGNVLTRNIFRVSDNQYEVLYSPTVWSERPEQTSVLFEIKVTGYTMATPFTDLQSTKQSCINFYVHDHADEESESFCGKQSVFYHVPLSHYQALQVFAVAHNRESVEIAESSSVMLTIHPYPAWSPSPYVLHSEARMERKAAKEHRCSDVFQHWVVATFIAGESDGRAFDSNAKNWEANLYGVPGEGQECGPRLLLFVASDIDPNAMSAYREILEGFPMSEMHILSSKWYDCFLGTAETSQQTQQAFSSFGKAHTSPWPGGTQRVRKGYFLSGNILLHPSCVDSEFLMVVEADVRFTGQVQWDFTKEMISRRTVVATTYAMNHRGAHVHPVQGWSGCDGLFEEAIRHWRAVECKGDLGSRPQKRRASALAANTIVIGTGGESPAVQDDGLWLCKGESPLLWNRLLHLSKVQIFQPQLLGMQRVWNFLLGVKASEGIRHKKWTWMAIMTLLVLWEVEEDMWMDVSSSVPVEEFDVFDEITLTFPLNKTPEPNRDIFNHAEPDKVRIEALTVDEGKISRPLLAPNTLASLCSRLHAAAWHVCDQNTSEVHRRIDGAYIASMEGVFLDANTFHPAVYGAIYDSAYTLSSQLYVREPCTQYISRHHLVIKHFPRLIVASNVVYPTSFGHMLHEVLPRLLWLATELPEEIPILIVMNPFVKKVLALLVSKGVPVGPNRMIHWEENQILYGHAGIRPQASTCFPFGTVRSMTIIAADRLYFYGEYPFFQGDSTLAGRSSFHPPSMLQRARRALIPVPPARDMRNHILLQQRPPPPWGRSLVNHDDVLARLILEFPSRDVRVFTGDGSLVSQMEAFNTAWAVVGPHGAGFANLIFCEPNTTVVEIGWGCRHEDNRRDGAPPVDVNSDKSAGEPEEEWLSDIFFSLATALDLEYWLVLALRGGQVSPMWVDVDLIIEALNGQGGPAKWTEWAMSSQA